MNSVIINLPKKDKSAYMLEPHKHKIIAMETALINESEGGSYMECVDDLSSTDLLHKCSRLPTSQ